MAESVMFARLTGVQWTLVVFGLLAGHGVGIFAMEQGQSCTNPDGRPGKCILFRECQPLITIFKKPISTAYDTKFLTDSRCGTVNRKTLVCCVEQTDDTLLPETPTCGVHLSDRIVGGSETDLEEFPWTVLIGYNKLNDSIGFYCGGSLINERYVVTAAHCVDSLPRGWKITHVRLGEWDLATTEDCQRDYCADPPVNEDIEEIIVHNRYDSRDMSKANDIALIRLMNRVSFSETIRPICLPVAEPIRRRNHDGMLSFAAGWGKTETASASEVKMKVELTIKSLEECSSYYRRIGVLLKPIHLCAGGARGKDTCTGDSGGPLMRQLSGTWYLLGVVSFGPQKCGTAGVPGIYVRVAEYIDWIQENIH